MDVLYQMGAIFGLFAFFQVNAISAKLRRMERSETSSLHLERSSVKDDMAKLLAPYIGKEVVFDFYEDEEDEDLLLAGKHSKVILLDVDEKWAMIHMEMPKAHKEKLIRVSSVKGVSFPE